MEFESILRALNFESIIEEKLSIEFQKKESIIEEISRTAYDSDTFDFPICNRKPFTRLIVITYLLTKAYPEYATLNVKHEIIVDTFRDVSLLANLYYKETGKIGLSKDNVKWLRHIMNKQIFKIGCLQFQKFKMIYLEEEIVGFSYFIFSNEQKSRLPAGTPVINCHIQYGANLSPELVDKSLREARIFFNKTFPDEEFKAFLCYSWLLYPAMLENLSDDSNIKRFSQNFTIIGSINDSDQAMQNLFRGIRDKNVGGMTKLQLLAHEDPESFGYGCGIQLF